MYPSIFSSILIDVYTHTRTRAHTQVLECFVVHYFTKIEIYIYFNLPRFFYSIVSHGNPSKSTGIALILLKQGYKIVHRCMKIYLAFLLLMNIYICSFQISASIISAEINIIVHIPYVLVLSMYTHKCT